MPSIEGFGDFQRQEMRSLWNLNVRWRNIWLINERWDDKFKAIYTYGRKCFKSFFYCQRREDIQWIKLYGLSYITFAQDVW